MVTPIRNCVICFEALENDSATSLFLCSHSFHKECILNWLEIQRTCPSCRNLTGRCSLVNPSNGKKELMNDEKIKHLRHLLEECITRMYPLSDLSAVITEYYLTLMSNRFMPLLDEYKKSVEIAMNFIKQTEQPIERIGAFPGVVNEESVQENCSDGEAKRFMEETKSSREVVRKEHVNGALLQENDCEVFLASCENHLLKEKNVQLLNHAELMKEKVFFSDMGENSNISVLQEALPFNFEPYSFLQDRDAQSNENKKGKSSVENSLSNLDQKLYCSSSEVIDGGALKRHINTEMPNKQMDKQFPNEGGSEFYKNLKKLNDKKFTEKTRKVKAVIFFMYPLVFSRAKARGKEKGDKRMEQSFLQLMEITRDFKKIKTTMDQFSINAEHTIEECEKTLENARQQVEKSKAEEKKLWKAVREFDEEMKRHQTTEKIDNECEELELKEIEADRQRTIFVGRLFLTYAIFLTLFRLSSYQT